jgi:hypothetical protein
VFFTGPKTSFWSLSKLFLKKMKKNEKKTFEKELQIKPKRTVTQN